MVGALRPQTDAQWRQLWPLLEADADRVGLESRLIKLLLEDRARVSGNGGPWRKAEHQVDAGSVVNHFSLWLFGLSHLLFFLPAFCASINQGGTMPDVTIPGGKIRAFVGRIENLDTELLELNEQKKEVFAEAKGEGFDVKILKEIIKLRKQDQEERDEREGLLDLYMRAMEQAGPEKVAKAA
jgi:uncharacterized protein (UPF0335 family)